ncbi:insulinase family protein [Aestuariibacter sp. AA17]|uniref:Protease 3 n=1 Tax=Fluctibacter corallii TaxID=2984329 RepID=A0ABT3AA93_9ALTE|nr:insulinase family protein [Aestuariibacter sp. AA17]MCV2885596.1 insulinase family protein [Aestuariibacter sp. AA17]
MLVSQFDKNSYKLLQLNNGLDVLLVHEPNSKRTTAAMTIAAGHFSDPVECQGLAHLLEHMLFLGSRNFNEPNNLNQFVSQHGGNINAWTGTEHTSFHFDVMSNELRESLARFSDMLFYPLFQEALIDKEIHSIDAEFKLKQKDDLRRLYQVHKETSNPQHPFSKFSVGNSEVFRQFPITELKQKLINFHQKNFVTNNMKLCVISGLSLENLKSEVEIAFNDVKTSAPLPELELPNLYTESQVGIKINIQPIKQTKRLIVSFALPNTDKYYRSKPSSVLSHLLGDEGKHSLLAYLKSKNWATSLGAGGGIQGSNFKDFNINMQLTELGVKHQNDIIEAIFSTIALISKEIPTQLWRLEEKAKLSQLAFDYSDSGKATDLATQWSSNLFESPKEHVVARDYLLDRLDIKPIQYCLSFMTPENMRVKRIYEGLETDKIANWYNTPYKTIPLSTEELAQFSRPKDIPEIQLPEPNIYIPSSTKLIPPTSDFANPVRISRGDGMDVWFAQDNKFNQPKGDCYLAFDCKATDLGIYTAAQKRMWISCLMEHFNDDFYHAGIAGLNFRIYPHQAGFSIHTNGFSQHQLTLFKNLLERIQTDSETALDTYFDKVKIRQIQSLQNALLNKPINRLFSHLSELLQRYNFGSKQMLEAVKDTSRGAMSNFPSILFSEMYLETLLHGNWSYEEAETFTQDLRERNPSANIGLKLNRDVVDLRAQSRLVYQVSSEEEESAVVIYFQAPGFTESSVAMSILLEQIIAAPFFNYMRTEKQLGYLVGTGYMPFNQHPGITLYIQSPNAGASSLVDEIEQFLQNHLADIHSFAPYWQRLKDNVIKQLSEKDANLSMKSQRLWMALGNDDLNFDKNDRIIKAIESLELSELARFASSMLNREMFGELVIYSQGQGLPNSEVKGTRIENIDAFKLSSHFII